jgi:hypothetical protein
MSKYVLVEGDIVDFTDSTTGKVHRGFIDKYQKGRDVLPRTMNAKRDYLVNFDNPLWDGGQKEAWCAREDLELVRPTKTSSTVTFATNSATNPPLKSDPSNIKINQSNKVTTSTQTIGGGYTDHNYPWSPYYVTSDDFFDILKVAFDDTYGSDHRWHPEDLYVNVSSVLEVVSNTLANMVRIKAGKDLSGVKMP